MTTTKILADVQKLSPGTKVDLYEVDASVHGLGLLRYHSGVNGLGNNIVWQGQTYIRYPIEISGLEKSASGTIPRPRVMMSNVGGTMAALLRQYGYFLGCKFTRKRTLSKYLDAVNFPGNVNPTADPNSYFTDEIYYIDRIASETPEALELELAAAWDVAGKKLPKRQVIANVCPSLYRGPECGYTGGAVAKIDDTATSDPLLDVCGKRVASCKLRFGATAELPYGGFSSAGLYR